MRPIPASSLGHAHGLLRAIEKRGRLRTDEFVTEFSLDELFPPGLENALGRLRHFISYARAAGLVKEDRGVVELTEIGRRYVRAGDDDRPFEIASQQAEWLRRQLRELHMTDSIYHGLAIGLSLLASCPPGVRVSTLDFGRSMGYLGRAGWDNENTLQIQGERHLQLLQDLEMIDSEHRLTPTGEQVRSELTLPVHMSLIDIAGQQNPGGPEAVRADAEREWAQPVASTAPPEAQPAAPVEPEDDDHGYHDVGPGAWAPAESEEPRQPPVVPRAEPAAGEPSAAPPGAAGDPLMPYVAGAPAGSVGPPSAGAAAAPSGQGAGAAAPGGAAPAGAPGAAGPGGAPAGAAPGGAPHDAGVPGVAPGGAGVPGGAPGAAGVPGGGGPVGAPSGAGVPGGAGPIGAPGGAGVPGGAPGGAGVPGGAGPIGAPGGAGVPGGAPGGAEAPTGFAGGQHAGQVPVGPPAGAPPFQAGVGAPQLAPAGPAFVGAAAIRAAGEAAGLRLPDSVYVNVAAALAGGKHVLLTGAPGAGKTALAMAVARAAAQAGRAHGATVATAAPGWDPRALLVEAASRGRWVIADELDRAEPDEALGALSSFLAGIPVALEGSHEAAPADGWRIVATWGGGPPRASAAVLRRFALVDVIGPPAGELRAALHQAAGGDVNAAHAAERLLVLAELAPLGAGVFLDAARHAAFRRSVAPVDDLTLSREAYAAYVAPLLGDLDEDGERRVRELLG